MATKVMLGDIEIWPAPRRKMKFDNPRSIAKIDIPGGPPVYQDMGDEEATITWDGVLVGDDAYRKAIRIESLKDQGQVVQLTVTDFPELSKRVRIRSFPWEVVRQDRVEYSIELAVETTLPEPVKILTTASGASLLKEVAPAASVGETYTVKQGDTLWALAVKYYGNGSRWREIAKANGILDPRKLQVGQRITIPG